MNLDAVRFEIASLIRQAYPELPEQISFPELSMSTSGQNTSPFLIQKYAESQLAPKLSILPGVSGVKVYGPTPFEWEVNYNSNRIQTLGITSSELASGIQNYFREEYLGQGVLSALREEDQSITGLIWPTG